MKTQAEQGVSARTHRTPESARAYFTRSPCCQCHDLHNTDLPSFSHTFAFGAHLQHKRLHHTSDYGIYSMRSVQHFPTRPRSHSRSRRPALEPDGVADLRVLGPNVREAAADLRVVLPGTCNQSTHQSINQSTLTTRVLQYGHLVVYVRTHQVTKP